MNELKLEHLIVPAWPTPPGVLAVSTTRRGGTSAPPYDSLNLASHVGDASLHVAENRRRLAVVETLTWNDEGEEMETYEILTHEPGFEGEVLGHIEHHPGSGAAVLKLHGHDVPVLHYASVGMALRDVRLCYGYSNAYVQKVREVAA